MNENLKVLVERAVRPVRASTYCKRKMREELLAHVSAVFTEEAARLGEEQAALARTAERFGDPTELAARLQEAVPASDRMHRLLDRLSHRPGETRTRWVLRHLVGQAVILAAFVPTWYVWVWLARAAPWPAEEARLFGGPILLLDVAFFAAWFALLVWGIIRLDHIMRARIRAEQEWASVPLNTES